MDMYWCFRWSFHSSCFSHQVLQIFFDFQELQCVTWVRLASRLVSLCICIELCFCLDCHRHSMITCQMRRRVIGRWCSGPTDSAYRVGFCCDRTRVCVLLYDVAVVAFFVMESSSWLDREIYIDPVGVGLEDGGGPACHWVVRQVDDKTAAAKDDVARDQLGSVAWSTRSKSSSSHAMIHLLRVFCIWGLILSSIVLDSWYHRIPKLIDRIYHCD